MAANRTRRTRTTSVVVDTNKVITDVPTTVIPDIETAETAAHEENAMRNPTPTHAHLLDKDPTALHLDYAAWLTEVTGVDFTDEKSVRVIALIHQTKSEYQKSDRNQASLQARKAEWAAKKAEREQAAKAKKAEALRKLAKELGLKVSDLDGVDPKQAAEVAKSNR